MGTGFISSINSLEYLTIDVNNDNRDDIVKIYQSDGNAYVSTWGNQGNGQFNFVDIDAIGSFSNDSKYLSFDVDGDKRDDIVKIFDIGGTAHASTWRNVGNGQFDLLTIDNNIGGFGDGRQYLSFDVNMDGRVDIIELFNLNGNAGVSTWLSQGNGQFEFLTNDFTLGPASSDRQYLTLDVNGDQKTDIVEIFSGVLQTPTATSWISQGNGQFESLRPDSLGGPDSFPGTQYLTLKVNNDNKPDIVDISYYAHTGQVTTWVRDDPLTSPVYRFFNTVAGGHFFTASPTERDAVLRNLPELRYEGVGMRAAIQDGDDLIAVYRFFNTVAGGHFFTASEAERDFVIGNLPQYNFEGIGFFAHGAQASLAEDTYRFFNTVAGGHFFTTSSAERDFVMGNLSQYNFEGVSFETGFA